MLISHKRIAKNLCIGLVYIRRLLEYHQKIHSRFLNSKHRKLDPCNIDLSLLWSNFYKYVQMTQKWAKNKVHLGVRIRIFNLNTKATLQSQYFFQDIRLFAHDFHKLALVKMQVSKMRSSHFCGLNYKNHEIKQSAYITNSQRVLIYDVKKLSFYGIKQYVVK